LIDSGEVWKVKNKWVQKCKVCSGDGVILPEGALRTGENVFLDDYKLGDIEEQLQVRVATALGGAELHQALTDWTHYHGAGMEETAYMWQSNAAYTKPGKKEG
jgi:hypothetical protein